MNRLVSEIWIAKNRRPIRCVWVWFETHFCLSNRSIYLDHFWHWLSPEGRLPWCISLIGFVSLWRGVFDVKRTTCRCFLTRLAFWFIYFFEYLNSVMDRAFPNKIDLFTGFILFQLNLIFQFFFWQRENLEMFLKGCEAFGLKSQDLFQVNDLYENKNLYMVKLPRLVSIRFLFIFICYFFNFFKIFFNFF